MKSTVTTIIPASVIKAAITAREHTRQAEAALKRIPEVNPRHMVAKQHYMDAKAAERIAMDQISSAIVTAEGRVYVRRLTAEELLNTLETVERRLSIPTTHMRGVQIDADPHAQAFPSSYNGTPESTQFKAIRTATGWAITGISRRPVRSPAKAIHICLTDQAREAILRRSEYIGV